jgi:hypothetical protein
VRVLALVTKRASSRIPTRRPRRLRRLRRPNSNILTMRLRMKEQEQEHSDGESEEFEGSGPAYEAQRVQTNSYDGLSYEEREELIRNIEFQDFGWVESVITIV